MSMTATKLEILRQWISENMPLTQAHRTDNGGADRHRQMDGPHLLCVEHSQGMWLSSAGGQDLNILTQKHKDGNRGPAILTLGLNLDTSWHH